MNSFSTVRFMRYAKFDLAINKGFYRNLSLVLAATVIGITILVFFFRWLIYYTTEGLSGLSDPELYNSLRINALAVQTFMFISLYVASGCILHPLRNKQGRITHLTLPATHLEKYSWHVLICAGGTFLTLALSILFSDLLNFLLSLAVFGNEGIESLTAWLLGGPENTITHMFPNIQMIAQDPAGLLASGSSSLDATDPVIIEYLTPFWYLAFASVIFEMGVYALGNSIKYKYNLPLTYIFMKIIGFFFATIFFIVGIVAAANGDMEWVKSFAQWLFENLKGILWTGTTIDIALAVIVWYYAYHLYTKAQLTNKLNK